MKTQRRFLYGKQKKRCTDTALGYSGGKEDDPQDLKIARPRLERIEADVLNNFKVLGAQAHSLNGCERLEIMYHIFNQDRIEPFRFEYKMLPETGMKTKDFIAPTSFNFTKNQTFLMGKTIGSVSYLQILAPELTDRMLADFLDVEDSINVNIHIQSIDQAEAIKMIKGKISDLDKMKIEEQKKAVRSGYDMDVLPSDLVTYGEEAKNLLEDLQSRNERMFLVTVLVMSTAKKRQKLDNNIFQVQGIAQKYNCSLPDRFHPETSVDKEWTAALSVALLPAFFCVFPASSVPFPFLQVSYLLCFFLLFGIF